MTGVSYTRFQDDLIIFCQTKRQLLRCKKKMMEILNERKLKLSKKKTRIGRVDESFHFLGIQYSGTRTQNHTTEMAAKAPVSAKEPAFDLLGGGPTQPQEACSSHWGEECRMRGPFVMHESGSSL